MYIVKIGGLAHSAWNTKAEAKHQIEVLIHAGYRVVNWDYMAVECDNGFYFV